MKHKEEILTPNTTNPTSINNLPKPSSSSSSFERRVRPQKAAAVNCPRCDSINTKFCYYNNYSLSQPRYFCKACRRYWTEGGTLRNIPVGGGSRKNKRSSSSSSYSALSTKFSDVVVPSASTAVLSQNPRMHYGQYGQDLNLGFPSTNNFKNVSELLQVPNFDATRNPISIPDPNSVYTPAGQVMIPLPEFKIPSLGFCTYGNSVHESNINGRVLFPFEEVKTDTSSTHDDVSDGGQSKDQNCDSNGFWNGMMGGGSW